MDTSSIANGTMQAKQTEHMQRAHLISPIHSSISQSLPVFSQMH